MYIDIYFEILAVFGKYTFFKIILPTFLRFRMAERNFAYYFQFFDKKLKRLSPSFIGLE